MHIFKSKPKHVFVYAGELEKIKVSFESDSTGPVASTSQLIQAADRAIALTLSILTLT